MNKVLKQLNQFEEHVLSFLLPLMCFIIFITTFCRFTKIITITWGEELARYCMVWIIYLGISAAAKKGEHFSVTAFTMLLPKSLQNILAVIQTIILIAFNCFVAYYCNTIIQNQIMMEQVTPSLKWPMWTIYLAIPIGCVLMSVRYAWHAWLKITGRLEQAEGGNGS